MYSIFENLFEQRKENISKLNLRKDTTKATVTPVVLANAEPSFSSPPAANLKIKLS
jgi:hypothetical protein